jgi:hypothetical protein
MSKLMEVVWLADKGEAKVKVTTEFKEAHWVLRADALQDAMHELEKLYNKTLKEGK